jgi:hypothetical protein
METPGRPDPTPLEALPGLLRLGVGAAVRTAQWTAEASLRSTARVVRAAASGESAAQLLADVGHGAREAAREVLGVADVEERVRGLAGTPTGAADPPSSDGTSPEAILRARGAQLLDRSADVRDEQSAHPAYGRILDELAPDEARILRFMCQDGSQPAIDVRTARPLDIGSELVAPGLQMIGPQAGCRYLDRVPAYLNNLYRLGLIWFSREQLPDPRRYQVLEAQPDVMEAMRRAGRGKTVRRAIELTPFGEDFCATCLPPVGGTAARARER